MQWMDPSRTSGALCQAFSGRDAVGGLAEQEAAEGRSHHGRLSRPGRAGRNPRESILCCLLLSRWGPSGVVSVGPPGMTQGRGATHGAPRHMDGASLAQSGGKWEREAAGGSAGVCAITAVSG